MFVLPQLVYSVQYTEWRILVLVSYTHLGPTHITGILLIVFVSGGGSRVQQGRGKQAVAKAKQLQAAGKGNQKSQISPMQ